MASGNLDRSSSILNWLNGPLQPPSPRQLLIVSRSASADGVPPLVVPPLAFRPFATISGRAYRQSERRRAGRRHEGPHPVGNLPVL
jgi:hypothetical protein